VIAETEDGSKSIPFQITSLVTGEPQWKDYYVADHSKVSFTTEDLNKLIVEALNRKTFSPEHREGLILLIDTEPVFAEEVAAHVLDETC
jgi:hypothetical protein